MKDICVHKSFTVFSTGVPLKINLNFDLRVLTALNDFEAGFLMF